VNVAVVTHTEDPLQDVDADAETERGGDDPTDHGERDGEVTKRNRQPSVRLAAAVVIGAIAVLGVLAGWFGYQALEEHELNKRDALFLEAGRQAALNLTTIDYAEADADIKRVLDSATGDFKDEFQRNSIGFADVMRKAQAKTTGTVTAAGNEFVNGDTAQILVAMSVNTTTAGVPEEQPRLWRMRLMVQMQGDEAKVSNVSFVS